MMSQLDVTKDDIVAELDRLPPESLSEVQKFIEFLRFKSSKRPSQLIRLGGL